MRKELISVITIALSVTIVWGYAVSLRLPYMDQIPVFDSDVTTANMIMWARGWLHEGPFHIWFATPFSPLSVELSTLEARSLYQSWPPLAVLPIYLVALIGGIEPSATLVNWINTVSHGVVALAVALAAFNLSMINRLGRIVSILIAIATTFPILLPRGLAYTFGQLYCVTTAIFPYLAICILLETVFLRGSTERQRNASLTAFLLVITVAFFVDWSAYTFFAFWFLFRLIGGRMGYLPQWTARQTIGIVTLPFLSFGGFLTWRLMAPGSISETQGVGASMLHLLSKVSNRLNMGNDQINNFWSTFWEMHDYWFHPHVIYLLVASTLVSVLLLLVSHRSASSKYERRSIFITLGIAVLVLVPFYLHMVILNQHTAIHRWAIAKIMFAYAFLPFVILPVSLVIKSRQIKQKFSSLAFVNSRVLQLSLILIGLITAISAAFSGSRSENPYLLGRVQKDVYLTYDSIYRNTTYFDVVFSPIWEAPPLGVVVGVTNKRIWPAKSFAEVNDNSLVQRLCGQYNVVIAMPSTIFVDSFDGRKADEIVVDRGLRLLRFTNYRGPAIGCN